MAGRKGPSGEGSVYRDHDNTCPAPGVDGVRPEHKCTRPWVAQVYYRDPTGKRRRRSRSCPTQREAQAALRTMRREAERGITRARRYTLSEWITEYVDEVLGDSIRGRTRDGYRSHARYIAATIGGLPLEQVQPADVRSMQRALKARGLGGTTRAHVHSLLRSALKRAVAERLIEWNPADVVDPPTMSVKHFEQPTEEEARALISAAATPRELARVAVAWLALRPSEVLALLWEDVHEDADPTPHLAVTGSAVPVKGRGMVRDEPKTERSKAPVPLPAWTAEALRMWRIESGGTGYVFPGADPGRPMRIEADRKWWLAYCERAGVRPLPRYGIRGAVASQLTRAGASPRVIADTLRHSTPDTAQKSYVTTVPRQVLEALESVAPR